MKNLTAKDLVKSYKGRRVVDGVSIGLEQGEVVGLLGPNGAGKTTIFYIMTGLIAPDEGSVFLDNEDIAALPMHERARRGIGYLPQEPSVFRKLTVEENIMAVAEFLDVSVGERKELTESLLEEFGISRVRNTLAYALSGGERRRVEIARALVNSPAFLLLDEPFSGIDPIAVSDIQGVVKGLKRRGIGIFITDHNVSATLGICDRGYIIDRGSILMSGKPREILESREVRDVYLGENFRL